MCNSRANRLSTAEDSPLKKKRLLRNQCRKRGYFLQTEMGSFCLSHRISHLSRFGHFLPPVKRHPIIGQFLDVVNHLQLSYFPPLTTQNKNVTRTGEKKKRSLFLLLLWVCYNSCCFTTCIQRRHPMHSTTYQIKKK